MKKFAIIFGLYVAALISVGYIMDTFHITGIVNDFFRILFKWGFFGVIGAGIYIFNEAREKKKAAKAAEEQN